MNVSEFAEVLTYQEPSFGYNGKEYSICSPDGNFYVTAEDSPGDSELVFSSVADLLNNWIIQGKPLKDIVPDIDFG